jgi:hypothetical protein|tara:strand:- start:1506 stop:1805 length:300 start_codon:yes stop_codon:yes gene_type:complete
MSTLYVIGILLSLILIFQKDAEAGQLCAPTQDFPKVLNESYKEHVMLRGLSLKGHILQLWVNPEVGNWTATVSFPSGKTCVVDAGTGYESVERKKGRGL